MPITSEQRKTIIQVAVNCLFLCLLGAGIIWGVQYYRLKQKNQAMAIAASGLIAPAKDKIRPIDLKAHRIVAKRYLESSRPERALPYLERLLAFSPHDRKIRFYYSTVALQAGEYEQALQSFSFLMRSPVTDTLTPKILARRGITLYYLDRHGESRFWLDSCLSLYPNTAEAACFLGQIEASASLTSPRALLLLEKAVMVDPRYVEGWYQLGRYRMQRKEYTAARQMLMRALDVDPLHVKSHSRLGMAYYYLGDFRLAKKSYLTALALNPADFNTRYNLGELYYSSVNDTGRAMHEFRTVLRQNPDHAEANFKVGLICLGNNMVKEAAGYLRAAADNDPRNTRYLLQLAVAYEKSGNREPALNAYRTVAAIDPLDAIARQKILLLTK